METSIYKSQNIFKSFQFKYLDLFFFIYNMYLYKLTLSFTKNDAQEEQSSAQKTESFSLSLQ